MTRGRSIRARASGLVLASSVAACTAYEPASDRLPEVGEGMLQGAGLDDYGADWSCLGVDPGPPPVPGALGASVLYSLRLIDIGTGSPVLDANVRACGLTDITCASPVTAVLTPDPEGWVTVPLNSNFRGYLEVVSPRMVPYLYPLPDTGLRTQREYPVVLISPESFVGLVSAIQVQPDPAYGAVALRVFDCRGNTAGGVVFDSDTGGTAWYFENGLPNRARQQTDEDGLGGFVGTPPGVTLVEASLGDGTPVSARTLFVRAGWLTGAFIRPPGTVSP